MATYPYPVCSKLKTLFMAGVYGFNCKTSQSIQELVKDL